MDLVRFLLFLLPFHILLLNADSKCPESFKCGDFSLQFPSTEIKNPSCGLITVAGCDPPYLNPSFHIGGLEYTILAKNSTNKFLIRNIQLDTQLNNRSCFSFTNQSLLPSPSISFSFSPNITLFPCESDNKPRLDEFFQNYGSIDCGRYTVYYKISTTDDPGFMEKSIPQRCFLVQLPMKSGYIDSIDLFDVLTAEFTLELNVYEECNECYRGGGQCLADNDDQFYCSKGNKKLKRILFVAGLSTAALAFTLMILFAFIWANRAKAEQEHEREIELFLKNNANLAPIRYKYSSIKKMTKSFSEKVGRGGHGSVYKGKLRDGHLVAVQILNEQQGNGEEFMNEVASFSRTSHVNVVTLLGFCCERSKRALIYEFMPNGSLDKFIQDTASSSADGGLGHRKMFEVALGIARGLEYLHQGCNTRILHFDIKPHNILLDKDLNPKISDFGLAKLCPNRSSIVSMMVARGTVGYIAPEVFCRRFGDVSYKSDVYSYGMMVLEMAGGRENITGADVCCTSEMYFPDYIYKQLDEMDGERKGDLGGIMNADERQVANRKLAIVGLWCIQTNPKDRPSMTKVVEMLEGDIETLQFPPKPYLFSS